MNYTKKIMIACCIMLLSSQAHADNLTLTVGAPPIQYDLKNGDKIFMGSTGAASFCCTINSYLSVASRIARFSEPTSFGGSFPPAPIARGIESPVVNGISSNDSRNRFCWTEENVALSTIRGFVVGEVIDETTVPATVSCEETTLKGTYNTSVSEFNFLEISGRGRYLDGRSNLSATILLRSAITGEEITQTISLEFEDSTTKRVDIAVHDLLSGSDFGQISIRHNGAPGQLSARISYYDVTSTSPLDFTLVGQEAFSK